MKELQILLILLLYSVDSRFTNHFREYLLKTKGAEVTELLERVDLRENGSFGGRMNLTEKIRNQPVVLVHGVLNHIMRFYPIKHFFHHHGYTDAEVYGTTWGDPNDLLIDITIKCEYVKQIRDLLESVHNYTRKKVDVIGYSMGSVISRRAILGGDCEGIDLGPPLTNQIDTFLSVAGSNYGSSYCDEYAYFDVCNPANGLSCESAFLKHLNSQEGGRYEGRFSFAIASNIDEKVGQWCCGKKCASLPNANQEFWGYEFNHDRLMIGSAGLQYELVTKHRRVKARLSAKMPKVEGPSEVTNLIEWEKAPSLEKPKFEAKNLNKESESSFLDYEETLGKMKRNEDEENPIEVERVVIGGNSRKDRGQLVNRILEKTGESVENGANFEKTRNNNQKTIKTIRQRFIFDNKGFGDRLGKSLETQMSSNPPKAHVGQLKLNKDNDIKYKKDWLDQKIQERNIMDKLPRMEHVKIQEDVSNQPGKLNMKIKLVKNEGTFRNKMGNNGNLGGKKQGENKKKSLKKSPFDPMSLIFGPSGNDFSFGITGSTVPQMSPLKIDPRDIFGLPKIEVSPSNIEEPSNGEILKKNPKIRSELPQILGDTGIIGGGGHQPNQGPIAEDFNHIVHMKQPENEIDLRNSRNKIFDGLPDQVIEIDAPKIIENREILPINSETPGTIKRKRKTKRKTRKLKRKRTKKPDLYDNMVDFLNLSVPIVNYKIKRQTSRRLKKIKRSLGTSKPKSTGSQVIVRNYPINLPRIEKRMRKTRSSGGRKRIKRYYSTTKLVTINDFSFQRS